MTAMQVLWTTPGSIERCIMRVALAIAVLNLLNVLSGCASTQAFDAPFAEYQQRTVMVATTGGDSLAANAALQTATPWPRYANDTNIPADAARMAKVVQRYESGAASDNGSGAQTPPNYGLGATNGGSTGMGAGGSPPAQASPQQ
jgi:type IV pilus biogenesis protein CpaD/CtpE